MCAFGNYTKSVTTAKVNKVGEQLIIIVNGIERQEGVVYWDRLSETRVEGGIVGGEGLDRGVRRTTRALNRRHL